MSEFHAAAATAVRLGSLQLLDACCRRLSRGQATLEDFVSSEDPLWTVADIELTADATHLARAFAFMDSSGSLGETAVRMFARIWKSGRGEIVAERDRDLFAQLLLIHDSQRLLAGDFARQITPEVTRELESDLLHPSRAGFENRSDWLRAFSAAVGMDCDVPEDAWRTDEGAPFDRVTIGADASPRYGGPLVTSITACYRPDEMLITAVRSLCRQTWGDLEILVLDDGSGSEFEPVLATVAALDPRVRVVRNHENRGTYARRNQGIDLARGHYITFHDADDMSAPERIHKHVALMEDNTSLAATLSTCAKVEPSLQVTRPGYRTRDANAQSLMLRTSSVLPRLGYFEEVRRGGDGEYIRRIISCFGEHSVQEVGSLPLMLYRRTPGSLSSSDFSPGRRSRRRWAYQMVTSHRHRNLKDAPQHFLARERARSPQHGTVAAAIEQAPTASHTFDIAYLADFRAHNSDLDRIWTEVQASVSQGLNIAISQCDRPDLLSSVDAPMAPHVLDAMDRRAVRLLLDDSVALVTYLVVECAHALATGLLPRTAWKVCGAELRGGTRREETAAASLPSIIDADAMLRELGVRRVESTSRAPGLADDRRRAPVSPG